MTNAIKTTNKYRYKNKSTTINDFGIIHIDSTLMDAFCAYSLSQNYNIHKHELANLNTVLHTINEEYFNNDQVLILKYRFILEILQNRLKGIHDRDLLLSAADRVVDVHALTSDGKLLRELSDEEVTYIKFTVSEIQNNLYMYKHMDRLKSLLDEYTNADFRNKRPILKNIRESVTGMLTQFRKNDINDDSTDTVFRLSDMETAVTDIHKQITNPTFKLVTGRM